MSERAIARHRAPQRPRTPIDSLTDTLSGQLNAVTEQLGSVSRSGAVLAVSTGLVATMGLPATAVTKTAPETGASLARSQAVSASAVLPASVVGGSAVTAPSSAQVTFERPSFTVTRTRVPAPRVTQHPSRSTSRSSAKSTSSTASSSGSTKTSQGSGGFGSAKGASIVSVARKYIGIPYRYGGTTTAGFDCSGFTKFVFGQVGISLPRTSGAQYAAVRHISSGEAHSGDLVFIFSGGRVSHVGILTSPGMMIDSPRSGKSISERAIWSSNVAYGRP